MPITGIIASVLEPVVQGVIARRPSGQSGPSPDPAETEIRSLLELGGDVWTLDEDQGEDAVGLFNGLTWGSNAAKSPSPLLGEAMFNDPASEDDNQPLTGDQTTAPAFFNGDDFSVYGWLKYTSGGTATLLRCEADGFTFMRVQINGTTCSFFTTDRYEIQYSGSFTVPSGLSSTWTMFKIQRLGGDVYVSLSNANGLEGSATSGAFGTNQDWSEPGRACEMGSAGTGCTISLDQILYLETSDFENDVEGYWYNDGAGRTLTP